jgi:hypothetical protein
MTNYISQGLYVAADGNWGDASGMSIIDDTDWTEAEYTLLHEATDMGKADTADKIDAWVKLGRPEGDFETWQVTAE